MSDSITQWISGVKRKDESATEHLWNKYYRNLVRVARNRLRENPRGDYDEEDAAVSALVSFFEGAGKNRFPRLSDRDGLWKLLTTIVIRKVNRRLRRKASVDLEPSLAGIVESTNQQSDFVEAEEQVDYLFSLLKSDELRQTALLRMEGYSNKAAAEMLNCSVKSIERRMRLVRNTWEKECVT